MIEFLCIAVSCAIVLMLWKSRLNYLALPKLPNSSLLSPPDLTVIIPARNEAHQIARVVSSFHPLPVIVVDDASTDGTATVARSAGAFVLEAPPLPPTAKGKPNACAAGAAIAKTKWILFVDADTWFEPLFAISLVSYAETQGLQMVSAFLEQQCESLAEKMLLPYAFALYFTGVSARSVNRQGSGAPLANGQCLLFLRSAYQQIGGHQAVIESVIEDVAIAKQAKKHNLSLRVIRAEHLGHVRMYDSAAAIWRGFQKKLFPLPASKSHRRLRGRLLIHIANLLATTIDPRFARLSKLAGPVSLVDSLTGLAAIRNALLHALALVYGSAKPHLASSSGPFRRLPFSIDRA